MQNGAPTIGIVGPGRLGSSLAAALVGAGHRLVAVAGTTPGSGHELADSLGGGVSAADSPQDVANAAKLVFLCVPDSRISSLAASIQWRADHFVVHCSGTMGLDALAAVTTAGATAGCLHPLQTFPSRTPEPSRFEGISCGIEAAESLGGLLSDVAISLGGRPFSLDGVDRALYHAAAVVSSNLVVALSSAAGRLWELAGLPPDDSREALAPLTLATAENIARLELAEALTGPVARGDVDTVERHLAALGPDPELRELYRRLSAELLRLPLQLSPRARSALAEILAQELS